MSNDLISRSAVIAIIQKEIERTASYAEHDTQINIMHGVEALPTAYDVDKVVEQLNSAKKIMMPVLDYAKAVKIVKSGGIE